MTREIILIYPDGTERPLGAGSAEGVGRALVRSLVAAMAPGIEAAARSTIAALGNLAPAPSSIAVRSDGSLYVGGSFTGWDGIAGEGGVGRWDPATNSWTWEK